MKKVLLTTCFLFMSSGLVAEERIKTLRIIPQDQEETVLAILPLKKNDAVDQTTIDISKRLLLATEKFEQVDITWKGDSGLFSVSVIPKLYFEKVKWMGDPVKKQGKIQKKCVRINESVNLTEKRVSQITRCLLNNLQGKGYLDAHVLLEAADQTLQIHVKLSAIYMIEKIDFAGRSAIKEKYLARKLSNKVGHPFLPNKIEEDSKKILRAFFDNGFYLAEVFKPKLLVDPKAKTIKIGWAVRENQKMEIRFTGDVRSNRYLKELIEREESFSKWFAEELVDTMLTELQQDGYLAAKVDVESEFDQEGVKVISLKTDRGKRYFLKAPDWIGISKKDEFNKYYDRFSELREGRAFQEEKYRETVYEDFANLIFSKGYLDLEIRNIDFVRDDEKANVTPFLYIVEGKQYLVEEYSIQGVPREFRKISELRELEKAIKVGRIFDTLKIDRLQNDLIRGLVAKGFLDTRLERDIQRTETGLKITTTIYSGPRYKIEKVLIRGARKTKYSVIRREVLLKKGDYYEKERVEDTLAQIFRLGIARNVDISVFERDRERGLAYVLVDLSEGPRFRFEVGPGYGTLDGVRATFRGTYANIAGTARRLNLRVKANRELEGSTTPTGVLDPKEVPFIERRVVLEYFEPTIFTFPLDGRLLLAHKKENEERFSLLTYEFTSALEYRLSRHWVFSTRYSFAFSDPFNVIIALNTQATDPSNKKLTSVGETITISYLDDTFNPIKGLKTRLLFDLYESALGGDVNFWQTSIKQDFFYPLWVFTKTKVLGVALSVQSGFAKRYAETVEVPVEKRFYVGGENSVRGYGEKAINPPGREGGDSFFSFMTELNIPIYKGFDLLGFFDGGNTYESITAFNPLDLRYGAGVGARWNTPVGPIKAGFGFILFRKSGEQIGRFYLGVGPL